MKEDDIIITTAQLETFEELIEKNRKFKEAVLELQNIINKRIKDTEITYCDDYDSGTLFAYDNVLNDIKEIFGDFTKENIKK